jgi:glucose-6-phosphate dehydrogenase assembly protein OpcA
VRQAAQCHDELTGEQATIDAQLTKLHQCKAELVTEQAATIKLTMARTRARAIVVAITREVPPRPTFARASQNVAMAVVLLDTLLVPSTNGVGRVYCQLNDIFGIVTEQ